MFHVCTILSPLIWGISQVAYSCQEKFDYVSKELLEAVWSQKV